MEPHTSIHLGLAHLRPIIPMDPLLLVQTGPPKLSHHRIDFVTQFVWETEDIHWIQWYSLGNNLDENLLPNLREKSMFPTCHICRGPILEIHEGIAFLSPPDCRYTQILPRVINLWHFQDVA